MIKRLIIIFLFLPVGVFAQFIYDFEDNDISAWTQSTSGRWDASDVSPLNGSFSLHHVFDNTAADKDRISIELPTIDLNAGVTTWRFKIKYQYNPSDGNNWTVFLASDADAHQMISGGAINAYGLGVNFTGSDDILKLLKMSAGSVSTVFETTLNWDNVIEPTDTVALEIVRLATGDWEIKYNKQADFNELETIGTGYDNSFVTFSHFGVYYEYTSSADRLIWLDDIQIDGSIYIDSIAPEVLSMDIISSNQLNVQFNESVDSLTAIDTNNYSINNGIGKPDSVFLNTELNYVELFFAGSLVNKTYYNLSINNIDDLSGNTIADTSLNFLYYIPEAFDVVINEIMADPTPVVELPDYEYLEIKNTTSFPINLSQWKIKVGTTTKDFPEYVLAPSSYLILCSTAGEESFEEYGNVLALSFSSTQFTNAGTSIVVFDQSNTLIDSVNYSMDWSLERIDPLNTCSTVGNWMASEDIKGGTPGVENSIYASNIDSDPPQLEKLEIVTGNQISLTFNEIITESTLLEKTNYSIQSIGNPISVYSDNPCEVDLIFLDFFSDETTLNLSITNLTDECGNSVSQINRQFTYYQVKPYDVLINEIMADPEPAIHLPEFEYIEILNTTNYEIDLSNWILEVGNNTQVIDQVKIAAGEYLILCDDDAQADLQVFGNVYSFASFPSIPNTGQTIVLQNKLDEIISCVRYSNTWYQSELKAEGGWSLEQIDPQNPCGGENNWIASVDELGGTPGQENSVNDQNPDLQSPELLHVTVIDSKMIQLYFNEPINPVSGNQTSIYMVDQGVGEPVYIGAVEPEYKTLVLEFQNEFTVGVIYTLEISGGIFDCAGNEIESYSSAKFAVPEQPEQGDLIINEVLFNPLPDGYDFVEIYNKSAKTIDLKDVYIATYDVNNGLYKDVNQITIDGLLMFSGDYIVLTENIEAVQEQYYTSNPDGFLETNLPSFNDDQGRVILLDQYESVLDNFEYSEDMHFALLVTNEGVSLERISFKRATNDKSNWHSASELAGFATPAYENSQFLEVEDMDEDIHLEPEMFSPDNDGFEDFTTIHFALAEPGYVANIKIFDSKGRLIRYLSNNQLLGADGTITWDGLDDYKQKAPVGIYVIFIELFDLDGNVKHYKKKVVVATKW